MKIDHEAVHDIDFYWSWSWERNEKVAPFELFYTRRSAWDSIAITFKREHESRKTFQARMRRQGMRVFKVQVGFKLV